MTKSAYYAIIEAEREQQSGNDHKQTSNLKANLGGENMYTIYARQRNGKLVKKWSFKNFITADEYLCDYVKSNGLWIGDFTIKAE